MCESKRMGPCIKSLSDLDLLSSVALYMRSVPVM